MQVYCFKLDCLSNKPIKGTSPEFPIGKCRRKTLIMSSTERCTSYETAKDVEDMIKALEDF